MAGLPTRCCKGWFRDPALSLVDASPASGLYQGNGIPSQARYVLSKIFTWWNGATLGTLWTVGVNGRLVGKDEDGNRYFEAKTNKNSYDGRKRRWVLYNGYAEASKVSPDWHGWLHHTFDEPPTTEPLLRRKFELDHLPNLTGTPYAWTPAGSIKRGGERAPATGDYEAWKPDA